MDDQYTLPTIHYEIIPEQDTMHILDDEFKNMMEVVIAEHTGVIPKNYSIEYQRLSEYTFYPPLNAKQLHTLAIDNVTSKEKRSEINEKVYKQLANKIVNWESVLQTVAKRFITNAVDNAINSIQEKLSDDQSSNIIIQRFVFVNNLLKVV